MKPNAGDLLWVSLPGPDLTGEDRDFLSRTDPAGVVIFRENVRDAAQIAAFISDIRAACPSGRVLVAVDQEGGRVARIRDGVPLLPSMRTLGDGGDPGAIREAGRSLGRALRALGFDIDFAPVLDVDSNPANPVIGDRAFSSDPVRTARYALAFAEGLLEEGVLPCGKHFPGHGATDLDSHVALPVVTAPASLLETRELLPFREAIAWGMPLMMTAHVVYPALDPDRPATLSWAIVTGLLKQRLGYEGLVLSDDLLMEAVSRKGVVASALFALDAGCDGLLVLKNREMALAVRAALDREISDRPERILPALRKFGDWRERMRRRTVFSPARKP